MTIFMPNQTQIPQFNEGPSHHFRYGTQFASRVLIQNESSPMLLPLLKTMQTKSPFEMERALSALEGNEELLKDLASMFVEDAPTLVSQLKMALAGNDAIQARSAVHSLKGLVAAFYAREGVELAQHLENSAADGNLDEFRNGKLERLEQCVQSVAADFKARGWAGRI